MAARAGQVALAAGIHPVPAATRAGLVRFPDRLDASTATAATRQPGVGLYPRAAAVGARDPWLGHFHDASAQADLAG